MTPQITEAKTHQFFVETFKNSLHIPVLPKSYSLLLISKPSSEMYEN